MIVKIVSSLLTEFQIMWISAAHLVNIYIQNCFQFCFYKDQQVGQLTGALADKKVFENSIADLSKNLWPELTENAINPLNPNVPFLYPLKTSGFLTFSGGMQMEHWAKMG